MKLFYKTFRKFCMRSFDYQINAAEVIYSFNNIINFYSPVRNANSFCFKNKAGLVV